MIKLLLRLVLLSTEEQGYKPTVVAGTTDNGSNLHAAKAKVLKSNILRKNTSTTLRDMIVKAANWVRWVVEIDLAILLEVKPELHRLLT